MGKNLFGANISGAIRNAFRGQLLTATLRKFTQTTRTTGAVDGGTNPKPTDYTCEGFIDSQARMDQNGAVVEDGVVTIVLIGDSISNGAVAPAIGDHVVIEGSTYALGEDSAIDRDPDAATYTLVVRRA